MLGPDVLGQIKMWRQCWADWLILNIAKLPALKVQ